MERSDEAHDLEASLKIKDSQLQRKDQIIDRLTCIIERQAFALPAKSMQDGDAKIISIDDARRKKQR